MNEKLMKKSNSNRYSILFYGVLLLMVILAACLLEYDMHSAPWAFSDSAQYIVSAQNLIKEGRLGIYSPDGHFMPLSLHPPFYSLVLIPFLAMGVDIFAAIKWLNVILFCASLLVISIGLHKLTRNPFLGLMAGALFILSTPIVKIFDGAMSEPLFIFLSLANLILLCTYLEKPSRVVFWGTVVTAGLAAVTRYIGLVSVGLGFVLLLLFGAKPLKKRTLSAFVYLVLSLLPVIAWFLVTTLQAGTFGSRTLNAGIDLLSATLGYKKALMEVLVTWLPFYLTWFPSWGSKAAAVYALIILNLGMLALVLWKWLKTRSAEQRGPVVILTASATYLFGYLLFLWVSLFSSVPPDYNERMFAPMLPFLFMLSLGLMLQVIRNFRLSAWFNLVPIVIFMLLGWSSWQNTRSVIVDRHANQIGYATPAWRSSPLIDAVKRLPAGSVLYSNRADAVLLYTGRYPYDISRLDLDRLKQMRVVSADEPQRSSEIAVIVFTRVLSASETDTTDNLGADISAYLGGISPSFTTSDGSIYLFLSK